MSTSAGLGGKHAWTAYPLSTFDAYLFEMFGLSMFGRWQSSPYVGIDLGVRAVRFQELEICVFGPCSPPTGFLVGPYTDVRFGWPHVKLGPRLAYGHRSDTNQWGAVFYPVLLRLEITP